MKRVLAVCLFWASVAGAEAPGQSPRPEARPGPVEEIVGRADTAVLTSLAVPDRVRRDDVSNQGVAVRYRNVTFEAGQSDLASPGPWEAAPEQGLAAINLGIADPDWPGLFIALPRIRPVARDSAVAWENFLADHAVLVSATGSAPRSTAVPRQRPEVIEAMARRQQRERQAGAVCGNIAIQGERIPDIAGRLRGCGVNNPVRVRSIAGVSLSTPATMDCTTAQALHSWIERGVRPAVGNTGGGVDGLRVVAHYACRTRNNQPGARISEHGKGRAVDIAGIRLRDGSELSVLRDWNNGNRGAILRQVHSAACGPFGTVLGPNADRFHRDHFHFDTAQYRSGSYCR